MSRGVAVNKAEYAHNLKEIVGVGKVTHNLRIEVARDMNLTNTGLGSIDERNKIPEQHEINIPNTLVPREPIQACADLFDGDRKDYLKFGIPLFEAAISSAWEAAKLILDNRPELVRFGLTENHDTVLHIAAMGGRTKSAEYFVQNLVNFMEEEDLEVQSRNGNTAFCLAAQSGAVEMAEVMVNKNRTLLTIPDSQGMMPLYIAASFGKYGMVNYLYDMSEKMTGDYWTQQNCGQVLLKCVEAGFYDTALKIVQDRPEVSTSQLSGSVLEVLARDPYAFADIKPHIIWRIINSLFAVIRLKVGPAEKERKALQLLRIIWKNIAPLPKAQIDDIIRGLPDPIKEDGKEKFSSQVLFVAAKWGNARFIIELIRGYPDLIWKVNDKKMSIFHVAVKNREAIIFNLLYEIGSMKDRVTSLIDRDGNNMLHLVGKTSKKMRLEIVSGVALHMHREIFWYLQVWFMVPPPLTKMKNKDGQTPYELFSKNNKDLVSQGQKWMKDCLVVATLIVTIAFAAAFTVPGGYNQDNGIPIFIQESAFIVFVISDAISLFFSSASLLTFLSILITTHNEFDFLISLPKKLFMGMVSLFISITTMMVAFSVSFFILYHNKLKWIPIFVSLFAVVPVILFAKLQCPLWLDMFRSIFDSRYLFKPKKHILYPRKPKS